MDATANKRPPATDRPYCLSVSERGRVDDAEDMGAAVRETVNEAAV